jgi:hypothetical protein
VRVIVPFAALDKHAVAVSARFGLLGDLVLG